MSSGSESEFQAFYNGLKPDPILSVSEWADQHRVLSQRSSAEAGHWRTQRTPYLQEIMDSLSATSKVRKVVFMKGAQIGGTESGYNWIGYIIDQAPGPIMSVMPRVDDAKKNSKVRIQPMIEVCPTLKAKVKDARSRDSGNTVLQKDFPGGTLVMTGANSAVGLRSLPARYLFLDEVDAYPEDADGEGDPISLALARSRTFARKKMLMVSTPTVEGRSRISAEYDKSDQRRYQVPCPLCGEFQILKWLNVKWEKENPLGAWYECDHCKGKIENWQKTEMLSRGKWVAKHPNAQDGYTVGFHLSSLYSPVGWVSWGELADEWIKSQKNTEKLKTFVNTVLGETWKEKGDAPDWERLYERRENYKIGTVPEGVVFLTCGVDVQDKRIEAEVKGWAKDKQNWSIEKFVFDGDTAMADDGKHPGPWQRLDGLLNETWQNEKGQSFSIMCMAVDSGFRTQSVYNWCRRYPINRVIAVKGSDKQQMLLSSGSMVDVKRNRGRISKGFKVFTVGVSLAKSELYGWLRLPKPTDGEDYPPGYCHFPEYEPEFFKQLTAEEIRKKLIRGHAVHYWEKIRDRNEALDCQIYNRAAASYLGIDRMRDHQWKYLESHVGVESAILPKEVNQTRPKRRRQSSFL